MAETTGPDPQGSWLRPLVLVIGAIETLGLIWLLGLAATTTDVIGHTIWRGLAELAAIPYAVLALPGLVLAQLHARLPLALALVVAAVPVAMVLWWNA